MQNTPGHRQDQLRYLEVAVEPRVAARSDVSATKRDPSTTVTGMTTGPTGIVVEHGTHQKYTR